MPEKVLYILGRPVAERFDTPEISQTYDLLLFLGEMVRVRNLFAVGVPESQKGTIDGKIQAVINQFTELKQSDRRRMEYLDKMCVGSDPFDLSALMACKLVFDLSSRLKREIKLWPTEVKYFRQEELLLREAAWGVHDEPLQYALQGESEELSRLRRKGSLNGTRLTATALEHIAKQRDKYICNNVKQGYAHEKGAGILITEAERELEGLVPPRADDITIYRMNYTPAGDQRARLEGVLPQELETHVFSYCKEHDIRLLASFHQNVMR